MARVVGWQGGRVEGWYGGGVVLEVVSGWGAWTKPTPGKMYETLKIRG